MNERLDQLADEFERAWRRGSPNIEDYLRQFASEEIPDAFRELLLVELSIRARNGQTPKIDEYLTRFPLHADIVRDAFRKHDAAATVLPEGDSEATATYEPESLRPMQPLLQPGQKFGRCEILAFLGRGGMGEVYKARRSDLQRVVALKILKGAGVDPQRLIDEARAVAQSDDHPNVVRIHDVGTQDGFLFIEMEFIAGPSLAERLKTGPLPADEARRLIEQAARALEHAHRKGIIHRDIKPANLLTTSEGLLKVADFGLARTIEPAAAPLSHGTVCGTPPYMAPEQWNGGPVDWRADQHALGVTYFELLTGRLPYEGKQIMLRAAGVDVPVPDVHVVHPPVPETVAPVVARMMAGYADRRFGAWADVVRTLQQLQRPPEPSNGPIPVAVRTTNAEPKRPQLLKPSLALATLAALGVGLLFWSGALDRALFIEKDLLFRWTTAPACVPEVVVVEVDQASKDRRSPGQPLSRADDIGTAIGTMKDSGVAAIGIDLLMPDAAGNHEDSELAAIARLVPEAVFAVNMPDSLSGAAASGPGEGIPAAWTVAVAPQGLQSAGGIGLPEPTLREAIAEGHFVGHASLMLDDDGIIRSVPLLRRHRSQVVPSLSLATVARALKTPLSGIKRLPNGEIELQDEHGELVRRIPADSSALMPIDFRGRESGLRRIPLWLLLQPSDEGRTERESLRGAVAFLGSALDGDTDLGPIPNHRSAPLVYAHALAAETILRPSMLRPASGAIVAALLLASAAAGAVVVVLLRPLMAFLSLLGISFLLFVAAVLAFQGASPIVLLATPSVLTALGSYILCLVARQNAEDKFQRDVSQWMASQRNPH